MTITRINAYEVLASNGYPTIAVIVTLKSGETGRASVPYGASAGSYEAVMLTDNDKNRYSGKGVLKAIDNVNKIIAPEIIGMSADDQADIDKRMIDLDGSDSKQNLGGNAILGVSLAVARAAAKAKKIPLYKHIAETFGINTDFSQLPKPMIVAIEGGRHADDSTDLQEYCLSSVKNNLVSENIRKILETYHALGKILKEKKLSINVGNEGAFAPSGISSNQTPLDYINQAIETAGYKPGEDIGISIDAAASEFFDKATGKYNLTLENKKLSGKELNAYYEEWLRKYPSIVTMEDMHHEDDWETWVKFNQICKMHNVELIGDDLTVTNIKKLQTAIDKKAISAILIKLNQIGTLTETVECCKLAKKHKLMTVTSHRGGGETNDTAMVDLAVAVGSTYIKVGPTRGERVSKYNRMMEIERELHS